MPALTREYFESFVSPEPNTGCFLWTGTIGNHGYGYISIEGRSRCAHRIAWELEHGSIPKGLEIDHLCRVRSCVNPAHLRVVTHKENAWYRPASQTTHCQKGHPLSGDNLHIARNGSRRCKQCDREYKLLRYQTDPEFRARSIAIAKRWRDKHAGAN